MGIKKPESFGDPGVLLTIYIFIDVVLVRHTLFSDPNPQNHNHFLAALAGLFRLSFGG